MPGRGAQQPNARTATLRPNRTDRRGDAGFTLLESLIAISLAAMFLAIYSTMLTSSFFLRRTASNIQAANLVQEELDALRSVDFADVTLRTDGAFLGIPVQRGDWEVADDSGTKVLRLKEAASSLNGETGLAVLPGNYRGNFDLSAKITVDPSSPSGWDAGIGLRYIDSENHYRFRVTSGGVAFDLVHQGTVTTLWSQSTAIATGSVQTLRVVATDDAFDLYRNDVYLDTVTDATFLEGDIAVMSIDDALIDVDDVSVDTPSSETWDFESESVGDFPEDWKRIGYWDLTNGSGTLTVTDYLSQPTLKEAVVTISWTDGGSTRSTTGATIISE